MKVCSPSPLNVHNALHITNDCGNLSLQRASLSLRLHSMTEPSQCKEVTYVMGGSKNVAGLIVRNTYNR